MEILYKPEPMRIGTYRQAVWGEEARNLNIIECDPEFSVYGRASAPIMLSYEKLFLKLPENNNEKSRICEIKLADLSDNSEHVILDKSTKESTTCLSFLNDYKLLQEIGIIGDESGTKHAHSRLCHCLAAALDNHYKPNWHFAYLDPTIDWKGEIVHVETSDSEGNISTEPHSVEELIGFWEDCIFMIKNPKNFSEIIPKLKSSDQTKVFTHRQI